jgi:hypothetical protein
MRTLAGICIGLVAFICLRQYLDNVGLFYLVLSHVTVAVTTLLIIMELKSMNHGP